MFRVFRRTFWGLYVRLLDALLLYGRVRPVLTSLSGDSAAYLRLWPKEAFFFALSFCGCSAFSLSCSLFLVFLFVRELVRRSGGSMDYFVLHFRFCFFSFLLRPSILFLCQSFLICISILYQSIDIYLYLSLYLSVILLSVCLFLWYRSF